MARSHHRKKHKAHLQQFKHSQDTAIPKAKGKAAYVFLVIGAIAGLLIGYFASQGAVGWIGIGLMVGGLAGYFIGRRVDTSK
jgi:hypothetical protein